MTVNVKLSIPARLLLADMSYSGSVGRQTIGSLGSSEDSTTGSLKKPSFAERHPKAVRSVTVIGYLFCVSLAAIVLSAYYVVFWKPLPVKNKPDNVTATTPCRRGVTRQPPHDPHEHLNFAQYSQYPYYPSKNTQSTSLVKTPSENVEPLSYVPINNNISLHRSENPPSYIPSKHYHNNTATTKTTTDVAKTSYEEQHPVVVRSISEYENNVIQSTFVPSPTLPSPKSVLLEKLFTTRIGWSNNKKCTGKSCAELRSRDGDGF